MSKHSGLSQLADTAREMMQPNKPSARHYPVKKRQEKRVLNPNWLGIAHLEAEALGDTEIISEYPYGEYIDDDLMLGPEFVHLRASGFYQAKRDGMYPRPMFQVFDLEISSSSQISYADPCPACDDWSRTARCEEHHDRDGAAGLKLGRQRREERNRRLDPAADSLRYAMPDYRDVHSYDTQIDWEAIDRVPQELLDRIGRLPNFTLTVEGTFEPGAFLEVTGETEQGTGSFAIEVEPNE